MSDKELEAIERIASLIEQMYLAHHTKDEKQFAKGHAEAGQIAHELIHSEKYK